MFSCLPCALRIQLENVINIRFYIHTFLCISWKLHNKADVYSCRIQFKITFAGLIYSWNYHFQKIYHWSYENLILKGDSEVLIKCGKVIRHFSSVRIHSGIFLT